MWGAGPTHFERLMWDTKPSHSEAVSLRMVSFCKFKELQATQLLISRVDVWGCPFVQI